MSLKRNLLSSLALGLLLCACSQETIENTPNELTPETTPETAKVNLKISIDAWSGQGTRALNEEGTRAVSGQGTRGDESFEPVTLLLVPEGGSNVLTKKVVENDDYTLEIPNGDYEIFAVCGLPSDVVPDDLFDEIEIPQALEGGLTDFAVGSATISNEYGKLSASAVSITAKRQMAWLTATVSDIPTSFTEIALYAKGVGETYNLADKWAVSEAGKTQFTNCNIVRKAGKNFAAVDKVCIPCTGSGGGSEFKVVATTNDSKTLTYKYISTVPLSAGKHLTLNLSISDLSLVTETVTVDDWDNHEESGTLTNPTVSN